MIANLTLTYHNPSHPGWSGEISGTIGQVWFSCFTLNDEELKTKARNWYIHHCFTGRRRLPGSYRKTGNRLEDYSAWSIELVLPGFIALL